MGPVFALLLAAGCGSEPTDAFREGVNLRAEPSQVFLEVGATRTVQVFATDDQGNPLSFPYEVTQEGAGIDVRRDSTFQPIYVNDSTLQVPESSARFQFIVEGGAYGNTSFTVSAGGEDLVIPVQVAPLSALEATLSNANPALGETVTITAPAGTHFSATSIATLPGATQPFTASVAPDGSSMDIVLPPNLEGSLISITDVTSDAAPTLTFNPAISTPVTTPVVPNFPGTTSNLTPGANEAVTVTLTGATFDPATAAVQVGVDTFTVTNLAGNAITFIPTPQTIGQLIVSGVLLDALPQIPLSLGAAETDTMTVGAAATIGGTDDPATAPTLITPAEGFSSVLFDLPDYTASLDHFYKLVVTEAGAYTITVDWTVGSDIDMFICPAPGAITAACNFDAASSDHPEVNPGVALDPGTYYIVAEDFGEDAAGTTLTVAVDHAAPAPPAAIKAAVKSVRKVRK
jgi:hypothetical protein